MSQKTLKIATRESPLALWQANFIKEKLQALRPELDIQLRPMSTSGDKFLKDPLLLQGGKGLFVKELEEAMLDGRADIAVHSMKDVPTTLPKGLGISAIYKRDNPFDAFVSMRYQDVYALPQNAVVGTVSLRRQSQLLALRSDLIMKSLRGNIHTRLQKLKNGDYDAIILAASGLERMGFEAKIKTQFSEESMLPACGQGALGIESRVDDLELNLLLSQINDPITALCVNTERLVNANLGGNCHVPLAVFCKPMNEKRLRLMAKVASSDGAVVLNTSEEGPIGDAEHLAARCTESLLKLGAKKLMDTL